jgi:hypothetical protein
MHVGADSERLPGGVTRVSSIPVGILLKEGTMEIRRSLVVMVLGVLAIAASAVAAGPPDGLNVTVINTPANPVPVTGSTTVSGNVAATQAGSWSVGIDPARNQVQVLSSPSSPIHVVSDQAAPLDPFSASYGLTTSGATPFIDVPTGKLLIVEHIDFVALVQQGEIGYAFFREFAPGAQGPRTFHYVVSGHQFAAPNPAQERAFANETVRYLLEPGARLSVEFGSSGNGSIAATVNITGRLVAAQ